MAQDWFPSRRDDQLHTAKTWIEVLTSKAAAWGMPQNDFDELKTLTAQSAAALDKAKSGERNPVITAECNAAFTALKEKMRYLKRRWFMSPPLSDADYPALLLNPPDLKPSPVPTPTGFAEADVSYPGIGTLELHPRPVQGQPPLDTRGDWGYRIYYGVMPPGGATVEAATGVKRELMKVPQTGDELPHSRWTRRRKERLDFHGDGGKTAYFCIRYENVKGEYGPWGPVFQANIP